MISCIGARFSQDSSAVKRGVALIAHVLIMSHPKLHVLNANAQDVDLLFIHLKLLSPVWKIEKNNNMETRTRLDRRMMGCN